MPEIPRSADRIFTNGTILTMVDARPVAETVCVLNGKIAAVGTADEIVPAWRSDRSEIVDLGGRTLVPGFLDGHSHFINAVRLATWTNVSAPPVGPVRSIPDLVDTLKSVAAQRATKPGDWIMAYGYDATAMTDGRNLTRADLDPHFPDNPVLVLHVSLHGAVLNTRGFAQTGFDLRAPAPAGGFTERIAGSGEAAGLVMETSFLPIFMNMPAPSAAEQLDSMDAAQQLYASNGYTTVQDAPMEPKTRPLYHRAADEGRFYLDVVGYVNWMELAALIEGRAEPFGEGYRNRFRVGGVKVIADGSPQGKTAFWTKPLLTPGPGGEKNWRGEPNVTPEELGNAVKLAYERDVQVMVHCNGDAAIDMLLDAHAAAGAPAGRRTVVIHSQFVRPDQLEKYVAYDFLASFFTNHAFFWGDVHVENLGKERAYFLSPTRTASELGIRFSNHSDFAVTPLNPMFILWTSVARASRSGQVIGPSERISPMRGLRALTIDAAYQYGEERSKGSIEPGKAADFAILDANPTTVETDRIKDVRVVETVKDGITVFRATERP
ncbi:MAG TPA: amidohydrolase [Candidatus Acidoferrales bacterium]|nr:amidohydrolase [Candidatus Acidoferrales bacterium]